MENPLIELIIPTDESRDHYKVRDLDEIKIEKKLKQLSKTMEKILLL